MSWKHKLRLLFNFDESDTSIWYFIYHILILITLFLRRLTTCALIWVSGLRWAFSSTSRALTGVLQGPTQCTLRDVLQEPTHCLCIERRVTGKPTQYPCLERRVAGTDKMSVPLQAWCKNRHNDLETLQLLSSINT